MTNRVLTDKQQKFLDVLFEEAKGDTGLALRLAGYASSVSKSHIVNALEEEIMSLTRKYFSSSAPKAAYAMNTAMDDPTELGLKEKMTAARDLLDRAGLSKTEKVEIKAAGGLFILPAKDSGDDREE